MNINDNMDLSPSEKLNMLLDGETTGIEPSEVFYELSNSPELQQEFLDIVKLKQLMGGITEAPPESLRRGILAGIGLGGSGLWYYLQNSAAVAYTTTFITSKVGVAMIALLLGAFSTMTIMNRFSSKEDFNFASNNKTKQFTKAVPLTMEVPIVSSYERGSEDNNSNSQPVPNESENLAKNQANSHTFVATLGENSSDNNSIAISPSDPIYTSIEEEGVNLTSHSDLAFNQENSINYRNMSERSGFIINPANRIAMMNAFDRELLFSLQGKGISNNSLTTPDLSTTEAPSINDIGISLMYLVTDNLEVGLEFGQEFLVKKVKTSNFNSQDAVLENQLTFWAGLKANYTFNKFEILPKLRPTTSLLLGGTNRGWITKASAGLIYDISDKLAVFGGPEWTTGLYQFNSEILSTHKWGFSYGMALRF